MTDVLLEEVEEIQQLFREFGVLLAPPPTGEVIHNGITYAYTINGEWANVDNLYYEDLGSYVDFSKAVRDDARTRFGIKSWIGVPILFRKPFGK